MIFNKVITRDVPLSLAEAWVNAFSREIPDKTGVKWPITLLVYRNNCFESWRAFKDFQEATPLALAKHFKENHDAEKLYVDSFQEHAACQAKINLIKTSSSPQENIESLALLKRLFSSGLSVLVPAYCVTLWQELFLKTGKQLFSNTLFEKTTEFRKKDTLFDDGVVKAYALLDAIAKQKSWTREQVKLLTFEEIKNAVNEGKIDVKLVMERTQGFAFFDGQVFLKNEIPNALKERGYELAEVKAGGANEVKGVVASPGKVVGPARVVFTRDELSKVQAGDVLIAPMTTPLFMPAMKKASAFVTDEGGVVCHAAIVAREMNKPCIVGTKIATKMFKDGDLVEVNATNATARKL